MIIGINTTFHEDSSAKISPLDDPSSVLRCSHNRFSTAFNGVVFEREILSEHLFQDLRFESQGQDLSKSSKLPAAYDGSSHEMSSGHKDLNNAYLLDWLESAFDSVRSVSSPPQNNSVLRD